MVLIVSAFGLSFAYSPYPFRFLAYFTLISLFWLIENSNYKKAFWFSWLFGSAYALFHLWWIYFLIVPVEPMTKFLLILGVTVLFAYLGLYTAVFALLTKYTGLIFAPFIWAGLEFIRTKAEIGFPWGLLGYTQTSYIPLIQMGSVFGIYGISAWLVWINLLLYWIVKQSKINKPKNTRKQFVYFIILVLSFLLPLSYGLLHIKSNQDWFKVAIIQPNVAPNDKGDRASRNRIQSDLVLLTRQALSENPKLVIYPETATLTDITQDKIFHDTLQKLIDSSDIYLLTGTPIYDREVRGRYYNGAVL